MTFNEWLMLGGLAAATFLMALVIVRTKRWPVINERQGVTIGLFAFASLMLMMAREDMRLWDIKLFEVIFQAVVLTGLLNMIAAFHFASNKGSETARENTGKAFEAITAAATGVAPTPPASPDAKTAADQVADAAVAEADTISGEKNDDV